MVEVTLLKKYDRLLSKCATIIGPCVDRTPQTCCSMNCQKDLFSLEDDVTYLNGAYMSPILKSSEEAGIQGLRRKRMPSNFRPSDFFDSVNRNRILFNELINGDDPSRIVVIPSASYGLANVARNLPRTERSTIILVEDKFPSNHYIWEQTVRERGLRLDVVKRPTHSKVSWSDEIIDRISIDTAVVSMAPVHWGDGTTFDIDAIGAAARDHGALFIIDGTQSIGALPYDQSIINADAIIVSAYKWLLGPYATGIAYYGPAFDDGLPIEESWLNRVKSDDFQYLTDYQSEYRSGSRKYEVGEAPDFIKMPMMEEALRQLIEWTPAAIQSYCKSIVAPMIDPLQEAGFSFNLPEEMAYHLFGIRLPERVSMNKIKQAMIDARISVSYRNDAIRVSPSVYNNQAELDLLKDVLINSIHN